MKWRLFSQRGSQAQFPIARTEDLKISDVKAELIVYDLLRHHIHHLNPLVSVVWKLCDGKHSVADIQREVMSIPSLSAESDLVWMALRELADAHLLIAPFSPEGPELSFSRRKALKRTTLAAAGSLIVSISAPLAATADSSDSLCPPEPEIGGCWEDCHCKGDKVCIESDPALEMVGYCI